MSERCIHGMVSQYCSLCKKEQQKRILIVTQRPNTYLNSTIKTVRFETQPIALKMAEPVGESKKELPETYGIVSVRRVKEVDFFSKFPKEVSFLHIDGYPFLWLLQELVTKFPQLKKIRVVPTMRVKMNKTHLKVLDAKGIQLIVGYERPDMAWKESHSRSSSYYHQRKFMLNLQGETKGLFDELIRYEFEAAQITARYFCLKDEPFVFQAEVGKLFGYSGTAINALICRKVNQVLHYLSPIQFNVSQDSIRASEVMKKKVLHIRSLLADQSRLQERLKEMGIESLPNNMRLSLLDRLVALHQARKNGLLEKLRAFESREYQIVVCRYGLEDHTFHTLEEVGTLFGITRERVRQIEEMTFISLGIEID